MLKKFGFALSSLLLATTPAWAISGFYVGAGVGPELTNFKQATRVIVEVEPPIMTANIKATNDLSGTGVFGTVFGGYGYLWRNNLYLAGEINIDASSDQYSTENLEFVHATVSHTTYKMQNSYGLSVLPGYWYNNLILFYARLGYANGNFKTMTSDTSLVNVNRRLNGFCYGLGVNTIFTSKLGEDSSSVKCCMIKHNLPLSHCQRPKQQKYHQPQAKFNSV